MAVRMREPAMVSPSRKRRRTSGRRRLKRFRKSGRYGKYSNYRRYAGPTMKPLSVLRHLKVYNDPFSFATKAPKIPDGKTVSSIGLANRATYQFTVTQEVTNIVLFPGLECAGFIHESQPGQPQNIDAFSVMHLNDKNVFTNTDNPLVLTQNTQSSIHRWRNVSLGMHISLVNNAEENDGWWEACRFGIPSAANEYITSRLNGNSSFLMLPATAIDLTADEMNRLPSYVNGDLRDIKYTTFNCLPEGNEHDFVSMRNNYEFTTGAGNQLVERQNSSIAKLGQKAPLPFDTPRAFDKDSALNHQFIHDVVDQGWDAILIRVHGRTTTDARNSVLRITVAQNQEIIYDERSLNSRFHTKSPNYSKFTTKSGKTTAAAKTAKQ